MEVASCSVKSIYSKKISGKSLKRAILYLERHFRASCRPHKNCIYMTRLTTVQQPYSMSERTDIDLNIALENQLKI